MTINPLTSKQEHITIICDSALCGREERKVRGETWRREGGGEEERRRRGGGEEERRGRGGEEEERRRRGGGEGGGEESMETNPTWVSPPTSSAAH